MGDILLPASLRKDWRYSRKVKFTIKGGQEFIGWYRFDFQEWVVKGAIYDNLNVTGWRYLTMKEHHGLGN